jgi:hypothetical protein
MQKQSKKTKGIQNLVTVREIKTWLDGYCSAHEKDWSPNPEQWAMIRDKIFSLQDEDNAPQFTAPTMPMMMPPVNYGYSGHAAMPMHPQNSGMMHQSDSSMISVSDTPTMVQGTNGALKTPNSESGKPSAFA